MNLLYKALDDGITEPSYAHKGDAGLDLRIKEDVSLLPGERKTVGTGLSFAIPEGYVGLVFPRSGLASKRGITLSNAVGVIDSGYRGEVCATLYNASGRIVKLSAGERVCQMIVMPFATCELVKSSVLPESERGEGGFGSTGRM